MGGQGFETCRYCVLGLAPRCTTRGIHLKTVREATATNHRIGGGIKTSTTDNNLKWGDILIFHLGTLAIFLYENWEFQEQEQVRQLKGIHLDYDLTRYGVPSVNKSTEMPDGRPTKQEVHEQLQLMIDSLYRSAQQKDLESSIFSGTGIKANTSTVPTEWYKWLLSILEIEEKDAPEWWSRREAAA